MKTNKYFFTKKYFSIDRNLDKNLKFLGFLAVSFVFNLFFFLNETLNMYTPAATAWRIKAVIMAISLIVSMIALIISLVKFSKKNL